MSPVILKGTGLFCVIGWSKSHAAVMERAYMPVLEAGFCGFDSPLPHQFAVPRPHWRDALLFDNLDEVDGDHLADLGPCGGGVEREAIGSNSVCRARQIRDAPGR